MKKRHTRRSRLTISQAHTKLLTVHQLLADLNTLIKEALVLHRSVVRLGQRELKDAIGALEHPVHHIVIASPRRRARGR